MAGAQHDDSRAYNDSQYQEIRNWIEILYKEQGRRRAAEAKELLDAQFFDRENGDRAPRHHSGGSKRQYAYLPLQKRLIVVLIGSGEFTLEEIQAVVKLERRQIKRIHKVLTEGV